MSTPRRAAQAQPPPVLPTISELVDATNLTHTFILGKLHLNSRTLKNRLEQPWLFNVVELNQLANLLDLKPSELFERVTALAERHGEFNPNKASGVRKAGRPRVKPALPTGPS